jgi:hypothetical protein
MTLVEALVVALAIQAVEVLVMALAEAKETRPLVLAMMVLASTVASKGMNKVSPIGIATNLLIAT